MRSRLAAYIALYVALYAAFGVASPFWPRFFESKGLSAQEIGLVLSLAMLIRLPAGPLVARLADQLERLRLALAIGAVVAAAAAAAFLRADGFWPLLAIALVQGAALAPTTSIADALASRRADYGWIRGSASAAFVAGTLLAGQLIGGGDLTPMVLMNAALLVAAAGATVIVPPAVSATAEAPVRGEVRGLLRTRSFRALLLISALVYGSHAMYDGFAVIRWTAGGIEPPVISLLWSEAVTAEVVVFCLVGPALVRRIGPQGTALLAAAAGIVRWSVMAITNDVAVLALVQPLHGLTFALLHLACMRIMAAVVPQRLSATAQSLYAFGTGAMTAALTALSGVLYAAWGGASFFAMAVLCVAALPLAQYGLDDRRAEPTHP
ncbi:MAG TPA: MFS transporter [Reyranella sp.]|nr:MFS transporter [Reyranella sp.]